MKPEIGAQTAKYIVNLSFVEGASVMNGVLQVLIAVLAESLKLKVSEKAIST